MPSSVTIHREQLYNEVWSMPLVKLADRYGISDVALGKICRKMNIPRPGLGYWAKVQAGMPLKRTPLPPRAEITSVQVSPTPPAPPETDKEHEARLRREARLARYAVIRVPETLGRIHPLTRQTQKYFADIERQLKDPPRLRGPAPNWGAFSRPYADNGRYHCRASDGFDVLVSLPMVDRTLKFLNTLAFALQDQGFRLAPNAEKHTLEAVKAGEGMSFQLREGYKRTALEPDEIARRRKEQTLYRERDYEWKGSGKLIFQLTHRDRWPSREWQDGKKTLEEQLPEIIDAFVEMPEQVKAARAEKARAEREAARLRHVEFLHQMRYDAEEKDLKAVLVEAQRAETLRQGMQYLVVIEQRLRAEGMDPSGPTAAWVMNMRHMLAELDPVPARLNALRGLLKSEPLPYGYTYDDSSDS